MSTHRCFAPWAIVALVVWWPTVAGAVDYKLEKVATGLQQPTVVAQAPGDPNSLYIVERTSTTSLTDLGRVLKYDLTTHTSAEFLNASSLGDLSGDAGLLTIAFHPDFQTNGKFYLTLSSTPSPVSNQIREYKVVGGVPVFQREILRYADNSGAVHTVDWVGFKPGATGAERDQLYILTGDGGPQANNAAYHNRAQYRDNIFGKLLRIDIADGADAYPADPNKNYGIPASNPFVGQTTPASFPNTGNTVPALGEIFASGFRNPWRGSFDRLTGDIYIGDVGFGVSSTTGKEEINFLKAGTSGRDYGWPTKEALDDPPAGAVATIEDPPAGTVMTNPIFFRSAASADDGVSDNSVTGGYVYRGPIASLYGKYIFADEVADHIYVFNFNRDTDPATFGSTNSTTTNTGISNFLDVTADFNAAIVGGGVLNHISSFWEDEIGNLYLVKFADNVNSQYQSFGEGEVFRLVPIPEPSALALLLAGAAPLGYRLLRRDQLAGRYPRAS